MNDKVIHGVQKFKIMKRVIKQEKNMLKTVYFVRKGIFPLLVLAAFFTAGYFYSNYRRQSNISIGFTKINSAAGDEQDFSPDNLQVSSSEIRFAGKLLETPETLPYIFLEDYLKLDNNAKYTHSTLNDQKSEDQFLRVDKLVYDAASFSSRVTAFYRYNPSSGEYKRVLWSTEEQNKARYPETEIISQDPLTVRFYYDVSRPLGCYGDGCRSFWADHFRWDSGQEKFVEINGEFINFYKDLLKEYEAMNASGCDFDNTEEKQLGTLEDVYNSSKTNYCIETIRSKPNKRADLNKFFEYKNKLSNIVNVNQLSERGILAKYYPLQTGNYWEYEGTKREQMNAKDIETSQIKIKVKVVGVQTTEGGTIVDLDGQSDYLIKGNSIYSRESWGDELILQFPLYVGQKWGDEDGLRYRDDDFYAWHVEEKLPKSILGKNYDDCFKITNKVISAPTAYKIFCYGIGYVEDFYEHQGTVEEWKYQLVSINVR